MANAFFLRNTCESEHAAKRMAEKMNRASTAVKALLSLWSAGQMSKVMALRTLVPNPDTPLPNMTAAMYCGGKAAAIWNTVP